MFVIGRNVEVKVEDGELTIVCQVENVVPSVSKWGENYILATTNGEANVPKTDLYLEVRLTRPIPK